MLEDAWQNARSAKAKAIGSTRDTLGGMWSDDDLDRARQRSLSNRVEVAMSDTCGCFYCLAVFTPADIVEWADGKAARCPQCRTGAVLGSASGYPVTNQAFLSRMQWRWFPD